MTAQTEQSPPRSIKKAFWKYILELVIVIFGVYIGFMANKYQENQKEKRYTETVIKEMYQSLASDMSDAKDNQNGHQSGLTSVAYFLRIAEGIPQSPDTFEQYLLNMTRSFLSIQNTASFEALKSNGLNVITNDSLRSKIVHLYDFQYDILEKIEEEYPESNFMERYYQDIIVILSKGLTLGKSGKVTQIQVPLPITPEERARLFFHLKRIRYARAFNLQIYNVVLKEMADLRAALKAEYGYLK